MKWISSPTIVFSVLLVSFQIALAKNVTHRKLQEVNFSEMSLKGTIRNPDGAYLVQKKGLKFQPLYKVQESFDKKLRETSLFID